MGEEPNRANAAERQQKAAAKQDRRDERKKREAAAKRKAARTRRIRNGTVMILAAGMFALIGWVIVRELFPPELPGVQAMPHDGRTHLAAGQTATYATATPTSGPHAPSSPRCGVYRETVPLEFAVHALEHGVVVVWHQEGLNADELAELRRLVEGFDDQVMLAPNPALRDPIVATAWNRLKAYDSAVPEIATFIKTYMNRGPERVGCPT